MSGVEPAGRRDGPEAHLQASMLHNQGGPLPVPAHTGQLVTHTTGKALTFIISIIQVKNSGGGGGGGESSCWGRNQVGKKEKE